MGGDLLPALAPEVDGCPVISEIISESDVTRFDSLQWCSNTKGRVVSPSDGVSPSRR